MELGKMFQVFERLGESKLGKFFKRGVYNERQDATEFTKYELFFGVPIMPLTDGYGGACIARLKVHDVTWVINFSLTIYDEDNPGDNYIKINGMFDPAEEGGTNDGPPIQELKLAHAYIKRTEEVPLVDLIEVADLNNPSTERSISGDEVKIILETLLTDCEYDIEKWPEPDPMGPASRYE